MSYKKRAFFVFIASCCFNLALFAQAVSLHLNNVSVGKAMDELKNKSGYSFVYATGDLDTNKTVNVNATELDEAVKQILTGQSVSYEIKGKNIIIKNGKSAQAPVSDKRKKVAGVIKDAEGEPVIGATVIEQGTSNGTVTDIDGNFNLEVASNGTLRISYIGYTEQLIAVTNRTDFNIQLKDDNQLLDEVVVVGFGSQKKVNLTGSVSTVTSEVFESRPVQNAAMALQGTIPGLNISKGVGTLDSAPTIEIRGLATIGDGSKGNPLVLIDGMEGDLNMLNPQDIETVSVLKDAASSSIYGSRAPFGVILITTKKGSSDKITVNYNNSFRWSTPTRRPHTVDSYSFATYFNDAAQNAKRTGHFSPERMQRIRDYMDGKINTVNIPDPNNPKVWADGYDYANANVDWYDEIYSKWAFAQEHTASASGGGEKVQMYASINYMGTDGQIKAVEDTYERYATNLKVNSQLNNYLQINYNMKYSRSDYDRPSRIGEVDKLGYQTWPVLPVYDDNGYLFDSPSPLLSLREGGRDKTRKDILSQQLDVIVTPLKGWEIKGEINYAINRRRNHWDLQKTYKHDVAGDIIPNNNTTEVYELSESTDYWNVNAYTTYNMELPQGHNIKVMGGFQSEYFESNDFSAKRNGILLSGMDVIDITNGTDGSGKIVPPSVSGKREEWAVLGFFGRINYDYNGKYLAEFNLRHDGSSRFRSDKRWKTFPSVSVGWNIARENFWEEYAPYVSMFKLRASYGVLGNQNTEKYYPTYVSMPLGTADGGWIINGKKPNTAEAPKLVSSVMTWEMVKNFNIALDVAALDNRLNFTYEWFQRKTEDMIGPAPELPVILGTEVPKTNNTDLRTRGWDLTIAWRDRINKDLSYHVAFNLSDAQTVVTNYPNETFDLGKSYYSGKKVGEIWGYETIGIAKTQEEMDRHLASLPNGGQSAIGSQWEAGDIMYKDLNGDGKVSNGSNTLHDHGDLKVIGNDTPRFRFGLNLGAEWKNLDMSMFFQGVMKRDYWAGGWNFWGYTDWIWRSTGYKEHMDYFRNDTDHYLGLNLNSYYPRPVDGTDKNQKVQSRYVQNAAYIRLKNLQIGYSLPNNITHKIGIAKFRLFFSGENLWVGTGLKKMFDPEALGHGNENIGYPLSKTVSFGASITL